MALPKWSVDSSDIKFYKSDFKDNKYICETAGFIPLEVRLKKFEEAGYRAQFSANEFTSSDYRDMYLGPNTEIYPSDDLETIQEKLALREQISISKLDETAERSDALQSSPLVESVPEVAIKETVKDSSNT